jgi:ubiquinone/menaquinone biosynthesis C-methylase UbiE
MKPKEIHMEGRVPINEWATDNKSTIMDAIYDNVFDFVRSNEEDRIVLRIIAGPTQTKKPRSINDLPMNVDFVISKEDIKETLEKLLEHCIEVEEYEKCAEIVKLQNEPPKKKRGRPKKTIIK